MENDFVIFHKFTDYDTVKEFSDLLSSMGIVNRMQDNNQSYVKFAGYTQVDFAYGINIRQKDFKKAEELLEAYYKEQIPRIDRSYYLFNEPDTELIKIIRQPYDWGKLDLVLSKHILAERGIPVEDAHIENSKQEQIRKEKVITPVSKLKLLAGYVLSLTFPLIGIFIGLDIFYDRKLLANGERFYLHTEADRQHGRNMIIICILWYLVFFTLFFYQRS
ncbi:MAG: hypothetical protein QM791_14615 [Ferruginibacter sp.]